MGENFKKFFTKKMMTARKDHSSKPHLQTRPQGRQIFQNRSSGVSLTPGEKDIIRGICQNKFFGRDYYNRWSKHPTGVSNSILASRRFTPSLPAPERRTFLDFLPHVHASPIVPPLWPKDEFTSGILNIVREVKVRHLARNLCSSGVVMMSPNPDLGTSASATETNIKPSLSSKAIDEKPIRGNQRSVGAKRRHQTPLSTKHRARKRTPCSSSGSRRPSASSGTSMSPTRSSRRKGLTKLRRVIEVSGKDGGSVRRKLYIDVFLPLVGTSEDDDEQEGGVYQSDTEQQDEDGLLNRDEYDNTDGDDVEYTD